jgi:hypothetical protein
VVPQTFVHSSNPNSRIKSRVTVLRALKGPGFLP